MSSCKNFRNKNRNHPVKENRNNHSPEFNKTVNMAGEKEKHGIKNNIDKYVEFLSWARWYPDLFLDLIKAKNGGMQLHSDQRTFMRIAVRFASMYGVYPRGWGKTFNEVIVMFIICVLFPGMQFALTAQSKENAAELLKDKYNDITDSKKYPWFKNEIYDQHFSKNDAEIIFLNGSRIDVLANSSMSKGQRRNQIMLEEAALIDDFTFQDSLYPIVEHGRMTAGKLGITNPEELSQKVNFYTTAGFRGSDEYQRNIKMRKEMIELKGKIIIGSDWHLGCWYGRGSTKQQIMNKKMNMPPIAFEQNYMSHWVGAVDGALVDINKLMNLRTLTKPEYKGDGKSEYILAMDVARSSSKSNNQSSIAILKIKRNNKSKIKAIQLVNMVNLINGLNFTAQAIELKRYSKLYKSKINIIDANGLGKGLLDELLKEQYDPATGETLKCWNTINTDDIPEDTSNMETCLYALVSTNINTEIIVNFMDMVESGKLQLLEKREANDFSQSKDSSEKFMPYMQTNFLIGEISNLKLKQLQSKKYTVEQVTKGIDKDRYSALVYGLWYIKNFEEDKEDNTESVLDILSAYTFL